MWGDRFVTGLKEGAGLAGGGDQQTDGGVFVN